jgi:hypothetical protein
MNSKDDQHRGYNEGDGNLVPLHVTAKLDRVETLLYNNWDAAIKGVQKQFDSTLRPQQLERKNEDKQRTVYVIEWKNRKYAVSAMMQPIPRVQDTIHNGC